MTRTVPAIIFAVTMVFASGAASNTHPAIDRAAIEAAAERLNMTEAQRVVVKPIIDAGIQDRVQILKDAGFERGQRPTLRQLFKVRGPLRLSRARTEAELSAVLDHHQLAIYRLLVEEWRQKIREKHLGDL